MLLLTILSIAVLSSIGSSTLSCTPSSTGTPIPIGVFLPNPQSVSAVYSHTPDLEPAINVALHYIQNESCILDGYRLELIYKDTECKTSIGMKSLFDLMSQRPRPVALFGGMCTNVNEPVALALKYWKIIQLSYAETHPKFATADSTEMYPTFFRIVPGDRNTNVAKSHFVRHFGWKRVGTVKQSDEPRYALPHEALTTNLERSGVKIVYTAGVTMHEMDNIGYELEELKKRDVRIIIMDVAEKMAGIVLCEAYHRQLYGEHFVWILPGYNSLRWTYREVKNCTRDEIVTVLEGHFALEVATERRDRNSYIVGGKKAHEIIRQLSESCEEEHCEPNVWQGYLYDGLWTLAIALSRALGPDGAFSHTALLEGIKNSSFEGVTGRVRFANNERLGLVDIKRMVNGTYMDAGFYDGARDEFRISHQMKEWIPPPDALERRVIKEYISYSLYIVMSFFALIGIGLSLLFLCVNIKYRNHRFIKMSSPNLNNLIIVGSMFTFLSVIMFGVDTRLLSPENFVNMCYAKTWTMCIGFTLAFGSMFSKTWRVHSIFTNIRMDRKAIKDSKLLLILGSLLMVDIVVLVLWAIISPFSLKVTTLGKIQKDNILFLPEVERCFSADSVVFQAVLYAFKGILMILGCFLAWETRHVNVPALNDSKYIGMSVYNVVVMSTLGLSISFILQERVNEAFALTSFFIIFSTTLTLCLVFVPKMIELVRNPNGSEPRGYRRGLMKSVVAKTNNIAPNNNNNSFGKDTEKDLLARAEAENQLRHRYLHQKSAQLWDLLEKLKELGDTQFLQQDWCFGSAPDTPAEHTKDTINPMDRDPLLSESEPEKKSLLENGKCLPDWPWVDPELPSTML